MVAVRSLFVKLLFQNNNRPSTYKCLYISDSVKFHKNC